MGKKGMKCVYPDETFVLMGEAVAEPNLPYVPSNLQEVCAADQTH